MERASPTSMLMTFGLSVTCPPVPEVKGTVNVRALLQSPFCWILTTPLTALVPTVTDTCVSLHEFTEACVAPIQAIPLPLEEPNPVPRIVTTVPPLPVFGLMLVMCGAPPVTVKATELLHTPFCNT